MVKVLLVEDKENLRRLLKLELEAEGYRVEEASDLKTAGRKIRQEEYDVFVFDLVLPDGESIALLDTFPAVTAGRTIIITANPTVPSVVEAIRKGAFNYLEKPVEPDLLKAQIGKIMDMNRMKTEHNAMSTEVRPDYRFETVVFQSKVMEKVIHRAKVLAETHNTILINGETGVGKEVIAHAIHNHSPRKKEIFLPVNCAAIPEELFESELFGHEKGAFTGAVSNYCGRFIQADRGTMFLDEIGELPLPIQAKLLRVLDERMIYRLKSKDPVAINVRLIAATNRDLLQDVKTRQFRSDLYYRLQESTIVIPPLREREEDILALFRHYMKMYGLMFQKEVTDISRDAEHFLVNHRWDGNVRELKNIVKSIIPFKTDNTIQVDDLSSALVGKIEEPENKLITLEEMEKNYILKVLKITRFNISRSATILGMNRPRLYRKISQYGLDDVVTPEE
jgi:DNA-binding NtrC family response regulator